MYAHFSYVSTSKYLLVKNKFSKKKKGGGGWLTGSQFLGVGCWERGGDFLHGRGYRERVGLFIDILFQEYFDNMIFFK